MKIVLLPLLIITIMLSTLKAQQFTIPLFPNGAPYSNELSEEESVNEKGHILNSKESKLYVFLPAAERSTRDLVVIFPGGGYNIVALQHEGVAVAKWLNDNGVAAVVVKYRKPNGFYNMPLEEAIETMKVVRENARAWKVDSDRIGVMGFSAGGHIASTLLAHYATETRPNHAILIYPSVSAVIRDGAMFDCASALLKSNKNDSTLLEFFSNDKHITPNSPPTFLVHCSDDKTVSSLNSVAYYTALKKHNVKTELHIYPDGGHGWGFEDRFSEIAHLKSAILRWIKSI